MKPLGFEDDPAKMARFEAWFAELLKSAGLAEVHPAKGDK